MKEGALFIDANYSDVVYSRKKIAGCCLGYVDFIAVKCLIQ